MKNKKYLISFNIIILLVFVFAALPSCRTVDEPAVPETPEIEEEPEEMAAEEPEEITPVGLWIDGNMPESLRGVILQKAKETFGAEELVEVEEDFDIGTEITGPDSSHRIFWVMAPVINFFTYNDDIYMDDLRAFWEGEGESLDYITNDGTEPVFVVTEEVLGVLEEIWGDFESENIEVLKQNDILSYIKEEENSFSIVPFESINKEYKILDIDGMSIFDRDLNIPDWPLTAAIEVSGNPDMARSLELNLENTAPSNRNMDNLATVNMTGVTAIVRQVARRIEREGVLSPGEEIAETLRDADITHISNEIPFVEGCTTDTNPPGLVFCSRAESIELLRYVGTDVIELTGNHMIDKGPEWMHFTLDMYEEEGWPYFGGGRDLEDSYKPATFDINGNRIAFLGANTFGPEWNWASEDSPGSARINMWDEVQKEEDMRKFEEIIRDLKKQGYLVIFTFQYEETYRYFPTEYQAVDFRRIIDAGADIVSGSQSHHPMGVEFRGNGFINYGLGNLFFGQQLQVLGNNPGIIPKHVFYNGKHINTVMQTTMLNDFSQPRLTTTEERGKLLISIFEASLRENW
ncbi:MAG: CapA family protein [Actinomycetota bacterium]